MNWVALAALAASAVLFAGAAAAQQPQSQPAPPLIDWDKIEIKTTDLGNKTYMLEGQGGNITVAVGTDGIIMVDGQFAPLSDKIKAAIEAISPLPIKYLVNTHFHGDHTGGNENFAKDGATIVAQDNIRVRLAAGTINGLTGAKTAPRPAGSAADAKPISAAPRPSQVGGRKAQLTHVNNAHTDGDTWVYFADANVLCTGDTFEQHQALPDHRLRQWRRHPRHDPRQRRLSQGRRTTTPRSWSATARSRTKSDVAEFRAMLVTARDRIEKLVNEGKTEAEVVAAKPLADLDAKWAATDAAAVAFTRMVYNSFKRS